MITYKKFSTAVLFLHLFSLSYAQQPAVDLPKANWYNLDLDTDQMFGISMNKSLVTILKGKIGKPVIVAVIDGGVDVDHEDLKGSIWTNTKELPGNGVDDDKNGYIDDIHGWNFLGTASGSFEYDNYQLVRDVRKSRVKFEDRDSLSIPQNDLAEYKKYIAQRRELSDKVNKLRIEVNNINNFLGDADLVIKKMGKADPSRIDLQNFAATSEDETHIRDYLISVLKGNNRLLTYIAQTKAQLEEKKIDLAYRLNLNYDPRQKLAEKYKEGKDWSYGNGNVKGNVPPAHGTHVAGIIGATRGNNIGIEGVANCVQIMSVRAIPDGDGLDLDEANAIRYAVDNGAKIINMSFGLTVSADRKLVQEAVNYALSKDVLFIQAAGNGHDNLDETVSYPNRFSNKDQKFVDCFIKVAASGFNDNDQLAVPFSNYGKKSVDVFAPGLGINSTVPGNQYESHSGTSMAAPVVSGLAAVIRSYFPKLSAVQIKEVIVRSVVKRKGLAELCITGGIVNAYNALKLASSY